jgi:two-component system sensor histidine kinase QseC
MRGPTLTRHLLAWTLGALLVVWGTFIALGYQTGQHEADELTDGHLASVTALLLAFNPGESITAGRVPVAAMAPQLKAHDYQQSLSVVIWDRNGRVEVRTGDAPLPDFDTTDGLATLRLGQPKAEWRVFSRWDEARSRKVMALISEAERDELADDIAVQIAEPGLWLLPVVTLALGLAVRRGLRPLYALSRDVDALDVQHAAPLEARSRHEELRATVVAINTLMERYQAALSRERALANEFAHEMRTPLAGVALHAHALQSLPEGPERNASLTALAHEVKRAGLVLADLLALARASRAQWDEGAHPVDVCAIARAVVADFAPKALVSGHDLALAAPEHYVITGHGLLIELALRNLVENALSHTGPGTQVEVQVDAQRHWLQVVDNGGPAGAAPFSPEPSMNSLGLGLGHRVVEKIAAVHGATFCRVAQHGPGHCYRIAFSPGLRDAAAGASS